MNTRKWVRFTVFNALVFAVAACTHQPSNPRDPLEPMNRQIYQFNDKADRYVMKPVATSYHNVAPQPVRTGVNNFFSNLGDASSAVNYTLQGRAAPAFYNASRFVLNSTVGLLGFLDVTGEEQRRYKRSGFGDTFARWGWKNSNYLVMPLMGPSTVRDGSGTVAGMAFQNDVIYGHPDPLAKNVSSAASAISTRERLLGLEDTLEGAALDPYAYIRDGWLQIRAKQVGDTLPQTKEEDINIDDLVK